MFKKGQGKLIDESKKLIQPQQLNDKVQPRRMKSYKNYRQSPVVFPKYKPSTKPSVNWRKKDIMIKARTNQPQEIINESSISYELSIQYKTPQKSRQSESGENSVKNHKKESKNGGKKLASKLYEISFDQNAVEKQGKQNKLSIMDFFDRRETNETQNASNDSKQQGKCNKCQGQLQINEKRTNSKIIIKEKSKINKKPSLNNSITSSKGSKKSLMSVINKKSQQMSSMSKKQQKRKKRQRKVHQIQQNGDIQDIAKQIEKLNKKSVSQLEASLNSIYSFSNSKSFVSHLKNSSSSHNSSQVSTKTIFKQRRLKSEQFCLSSRTMKIMRPDTDPIHKRQTFMGNGLSPMRRDQIFHQPENSTISFYDDKELAIIEESICEVKSEEISLLEVEDWVKFVCLILKLDKKSFNKIIRLINKVIEPSDPMEAIFYYAGACVALYAKIQCQHMFHEQQKEFPEIPHHSEHKRAQIEFNHPILEIKQLRRAEFQVSDMVGFKFQLHDTLIDESLNTCQLWTKYMQANKNAIHKKPFEFFLIGTENAHQRRNYLYCSYIIDAIQFLKELTQTEEAFVQINEVKNVSNDSPASSTQNTEQKIPSNLQMILLSIFVVISNNFSQKYCPNTNSLTDSMVLVSKFSKKVFKFTERKITHLQSLMKKAKQMEIENLLSRIELEELRKLETKTRDMKTREEISTYIQNKTLWFRNVGHTKTHQQLQWFL